MVSHPEGIGKGCGMREARLCLVCGEVFSSRSAFQGHLVDDPTGSDQRHCLTVPEMLAKGLAKRSGGHWASSEDYIPSWRGPVEFKVIVRPRPLLPTAVCLRRM